MWICHKVLTIVIICYYLFITIKKNVLELINFKKSLQNLLFKKIIIRISI